MTPEQYARSFDDRVGPLVREAAERVPGFATRLRDAGVDPGDVTDAASLDRIPILSKDELVERQAAERPFGGLVAADAAIRRVFQSPGPLYEPEADEPDPWRWAAALEAAGFGPGDTVLNAFGYHLSPAGAMFEEACRQVGCTVVPAGVGNRELQIRACIDLGVTAFIGVPSYLKALLELAEEQGQRPADWPLTRAFVSAEPLPPSLRAWLRERVPTVLQGYGTAEAGNLGFECERMDGLHVPDDALVEVCALDDGHARWDGSTGQVVVTLLRSDHPLVRFGTGDLSAYLEDPCPCGRPAPRLAGFLGRVGEAVKVRGMFLHPRQVRDAMADVRGLAAYRFVVERADHRDVLRCEAVTAPDAVEDDVRDAIRARVRDGLRFDVQVALVGSLPDDAAVIQDARTWE